MQKTAVIHQKLPQVFLIALGHALKHNDYHLTALSQNIFHSEIIAHGNIDPRRVDQRQAAARPRLEQHIHRGGDQPPVLLLGRVGGRLPGRITIFADKVPTALVAQLRKTSHLTFPYNSNVGRFLCRFTAVDPYWHRGGGMPSFRHHDPADHGVDQGALTGAGYPQKQHPDRPLQEPQPRLAQGHHGPPVSIFLRQGKQLLFYRLPGLGKETLQFRKIFRVLPLHIFHSIYLSLFQQIEDRLPFPRKDLGQSASHVRAPQQHPATGPQA